MISNRFPRTPKAFLAALCLRAFLTLVVACLTVGGGRPVFAADAILSWDANTEPDLARYNVHYGTSPGAYTTTIPVGLVTSYTVTGLTPGTYYFAVTADNTSRGRSGFSNEVSKVIPDTTPPVISAVAAGTITASGATVTWTTNEASTSLVEFGLTTSYGTSSALDSTRVTAHTRTITGLTAATTYHYRVISTDAAGNTAVSADNTFTTGPAADTTPPVLWNIISGSVTGTGATITWITNEPATTQVNYGTTTAYGASTALNSSLLTTHTATLTGLQAGTLYHFRVRSTDAAGNLALSGDATFTTGPAADTTPPTISAVVASSTGATSTVITWSTNEPSTSIVNYGLATSYGSSSTDTAMVTSHSRTLTGLSATTTYHFQVRSGDAAGNIASSADFVFTTSAAPDTTAPALSSIASTSVTGTGATITWTTNEASSTQVNYGTTTAYGASTTLNPSLVTAHSATLSGLQAATTYHFLVRSADAAGNVAVSGDRTFTTGAAPDTTGPAISGLTSGSLTPTSAVIVWSTNEPSSSRVEYGLTAAYGQQTPANATLVTSHRETLTGLTIGATYHVRVHSADAAGNASRSLDLIVSLPAVADTTPPQDIRNFAATGGAGRVRLTWNNPMDADFTGVQIRFRTDRFPTGADDGEILGDFSGQPSEAGEAVHEGLLDGMTYYYAAASYDFSGNRQSTVYTSATAGIPSNSVDDTQSAQTGGCGMILPRDGDPPSGPWQAADLLVMAAVAFYLMRRRLVHWPTSDYQSAPG